MLGDSLKFAYNRVSFGDDILKKPEFVPFNFIEEADKRLGEERQKPIPDTDTIYRVSGLSKMCPVDECLRHNNKIVAKEKIDHRLKKTFDFGNGFHFVVQNTWFGDFGWLLGDWVCTNCGKKFSNQTKPKQCVGCSESNSFHYVELSLKSEKDFVTGHPDGILVVNGFEYVMELKSSNSKSFNFITEISRKPLDAHLDQINMYMYLMNKERGVIIYFDKDNSEWAQFHIKYDNARVEKQLNKIRLTKLGIKEKTVPFEHRICANKNVERAKNCPSRALCFTSGV